MTDYHRRTTCRGCGHGHLTEVLDLGYMPPANALLSEAQFDTERSYPLTLAFCEECSLLQVPDVVAPEILFSEDYKFSTGASAPFVEHFWVYAQRCVLNNISSPDDLVVDVGGNDGTLLSFVKPHCKVLNIDPAARMISGGHSIDALFTSELAKVVAKTHGHAKVVTANNVLAHVDDPLDFVRGVRHLLTDDGLFICEVQWAKSLVQDGSYDHVYHEHLCYFSLHSVMRLMAEVGLFVFDVDTVPVQGESLRVFASRHERPVGKKIPEIRAIERIAGLTTEGTYLKFGHRAQAHREVLRDLVYDLSDGGARIIGYGSPAKASTLLNYCGLGPDDVHYLTDTTPAKQGLYSPGTHVPVISPDELKTDTPNYALLLSWNYAEHILEKEKDLRSRGTKFIVPFPEIRIV